MNLVILSLLVLVSIIAVIVLTSSWKVNAFIALFMVSLLLALSVMPASDVLKQMQSSFGSTMGSTGFVIILGAIIAIVLDKTGAAITMARYILSKTGEARAPVALGITGFLSGMSIFCDSGFIILSGLAKSFSSKTRISMPFIASVLACSLYSVHCLIPTHPGALAAAGILSVNIGDLVLFGIVFAIPGFVVSYFWIKWITRNKHYPAATAHEVPDSEVMNSHPSVLKSFLPIVTPVILIAAGSLVTTLSPQSQSLILKALMFVGQPVIALLMGVAFSLLLLKGRPRTSLNHIFETAIEKAGPILIVTAAGGMFGAIIKSTGIGASVGLGLRDTGLGIAIPFIIAFILKTAQGSSTVAIITAASIIAPMVPALGLDSQAGKILTMLSMGAGSMMISHANDSYFWVITKFSDLHADITLKVFSTTTAIMGSTVFALVWLASLVFLH
ncbi:MAG: GntP family permease [Bacteroidota bacterium]|nr:GntP family permease [Bacteroidota bacterium]